MYFTLFMFAHIYHLYYVFNKPQGESDVGTLKVSSVPKSKRAGLGVGVLIGLPD